jgi:hypothetical protein
MIDHGASPYIIDDLEDYYADPRRRFGRLIIAAKERIYTAWAVAWALSQHPVFRDMAQQVAQCIMATPVREFLEDQEDSRKKQKI